MQYITFVDDVLRSLKYRHIIAKQQKEIKEKAIEISLWDAASKLIGRSIKSV